MYKIGLDRMEDKNVLKPTKIILNVLCGSQAYGIATPQSDEDWKGVCVGPKESYFGLQTFEQWECSQRDEVLYELRKFLRLALNANPNILDVLFAWPKTKTTNVFQNKYGGWLRKNANLFLSQRVYKAFSGYAVAQIRKCRNKLAGHDNAGIRAKNPYKHAAHCLRLMRMGYEICTTGEVRINRTGIDADELMAIRREEVELANVLHDAELLLVDLDAFMASGKCQLPEHPDREKVEKLCMNILEDVYCG